MGLDTTHDAWHGPYSMFMRWRTWLSAQVGLPLGLMEGYAHYQWDQKDVERHHLGDPEREVFQSLADVGQPIKWDALKGDPLEVLLSHSDCDGKIHWWKCRDLAFRLAQIYRGSASSDVAGHGGMDCRRGCYDSMRRATLRFALGCFRAWKAREHLRFH